MRHLPILLTVVPLTGAFLVPVLGRRPDRAYRLALLSVLLVLACAAGLLAMTGSGQTLQYYVGDWPPPWGIEVRVDALGAMLATFFAFVYLMVVLYAGSSVRAELGPAAQFWYWSLLLLLLAGINGVLTARDLFNLFVFTEIASLSACAIISVRDRLDSMEAALKYLILSAVAGGCILLGVALLYMVTGQLHLDHLGAALPAAAGSYPRVLLAALALLVSGFALKSALFPLHVWLPDAHSSAPSPSSAILSGLVVKLGIVALVRLFFVVFDWRRLVTLPLPTMVMAMGALGIVLGALFAMGQRDLKRMLAYSTVVQVGYIYFGLALLDEIALTGALMHVVNHALLKSMLFLCVGLIISRTGERSTAAMAGLARSMPLTVASFTVGAAAMVGIPLTNGFVSKWYMVLGTLNSGRPAMVAVILVSSLLSALYYFPLVVSAYFGRPASPQAEGPEGPPAMVWPVVGLAAVCLVLGIWPELPLRLLGGVARVMLGL